MPEVLLTITNYGNLFFEIGNATGPVSVER